ncbi:MAG: hypothetical protein INQ03_23750 [Candidatus Heimdallarchaeota archaeon]|nr:hypothetical protein [Candidatus Heimdallarchaeota archaeon]
MDNRLQTHSLMVIGQRKELVSKIVWNNLYSTPQLDYEENEIRNLLSRISEHIVKGRIKSNSARKFLEGKLFFIQQKRQNSSYIQIYCLYTEETRTNPNAKRAFQSIVNRTGEYSAKRLFQEMLELLKNDEELAKSSILEQSVMFDKDKALGIIRNYDFKKMDINYLGRMISNLNLSGELDFETLEEIYLVVYEVIQYLEEKKNQDPDEFLDGAYITAKLYQGYENTFHFALELYKKIIPLAFANDRYNLLTSCRIQMSKIYKQNFLDSGEYILDQLELIPEEYLDEISKKNLEEYYVLKGLAFYETGKFNAAESSFNSALKIAGTSISSPKLIAEAYATLASLNYKNYIFDEAARQFLTASALSFSIGDIAKSDLYLQNAGLPEIYRSLTLAMTALNFRMEGNYTASEFKAWEALLSLVKAYVHQAQSEPFLLMDTTEKILNYTESILLMPGKIRKNRRIIQAARKLIDDLTWFRLKPGTEEQEINKVYKKIAANIPLEPPIFMLLVNDGRLILMGQVCEEGWTVAEIKGVILSGIISAITSLIGDISENTSALKTIDAGNFQIMLEQEKNIISVLLVDRELPVFRTRLKEMMHHIINDYYHILRDWDGNNKYFDSLVHQIEIRFKPSSIHL